MEDIEILRFLEIDVPVHMVTLDTYTRAVDCPQDIAIVEQALSQVTFHHPGQANRKSGFTPPHSA